MGHMHHFSAGWVSPVLAYAMACVGSALGLRCTVRALAAEGRSRRNWLLTASVAIGSGIWTMHFIAMLGFGVTGTPIRYDVPLTVLSLLVAMAVVGAGVFTVGHGSARLRSLLFGGLGTGVGVATMHYLGMAAMRLHGQVGYHPGLVVLSVGIAVAAATAALWAALSVRGAAGAAIASLVMGVAVTSMHYTGMAAVRIDLAPSRAPLPGATPMEFIFPLTVVIGSFLFLTVAFVALSPTARERAASASAQSLREAELPASS
ncbi:MHYT domain-containing protein [Streptomyces chattanoogensis]|uniref:Membrane protein n=1 Tax=Streptomyces chattanoogensis TaxID=66876 RepID=A0A0N0GW19_9ACTN|nr:MHYT domain-containing protein [Streptomyces chattanoogensis]KPC59769.1 membrane protein [Streptomyces chattanoogensis]